VREQLESILTMKVYVRADVTSRQRLTHDRASMPSFTGRIASAYTARASRVNPNRPRIARPRTMGPHLPHAMLKCDHRPCARHCAADTDAGVKSLICACADPGQNVRLGLLVTSKRMYMAPKGSVRRMSMHAMAITRR
jgi:hypothetical protein